MKHSLLILPLAAVLALGPGPLTLSAVQAAGSPKSGFSCKPAPPPVVSLDFGSRYTDDSSDRSEIDPESNADVNRKLKPVDSFISKLSSMANDAVLSSDNREKRVKCVALWMATWAKAGALSKLDSLTARLAVPGRFAGLAIAYAQVKSVAAIDEAEGDLIEDWLLQRGQGMRTFFETEAPPKASKNNLRLWAGLAATQIGLVAGDDALVDWGAASNELVACQAADDGSLPLEMGRGRLALHYQLHAVGPLVVNATLLERAGRKGFAICDGKIDRIVAFTFKALQDPTIVDAIAGKTQTFSAGSEKIEGYQLAWAEPYLAHGFDAALDRFVQPLRPLAHAKLGGDLTALYPRAN